MIDKEFSISHKHQACVVSVLSSKLDSHKNEAEVKHSLVEMGELLKTLDIPVLLSEYQKKEALDPAIIIGKGKLAEISDKAKCLGATILVFDIELSASQIRNIKKITEMDVIDRVHVILEIFSDAELIDVKVSEKTIKDD